VYKGIRLGIILFIISEIIFIMLRYLIIKHRKQETAIKLKETIQPYVIAVGLHFTRGILYRH